VIVCEPKLKEGLQIMKISVPKILSLVFLLFAGCSNYNSRVATMNGYLQVENGETRQQVIEEFGQPASIEVHDDGLEVLKYIEQLSINGEVVEVRYYYFYIRNGKVTGKLANIVDRPSQIDSTNM
jgi:hypothetical protein